MLSRFILIYLKKNIKYLILMSKGEDEEFVISVGAILMFMMLLFYMCSGTIIEHYKMSFGHEAAYTIIIGMLISLS